MYLFFRHKWQELLTSVVALCPAGLRQLCWCHRGEVCHSSSAVASWECLNTGEGCYFVWLGVLKAVILHVILKAGYFAC